MNMKRISLKNKGHGFPPAGARPFPGASTEDLSGYDACDCRQESVRPEICCPENGRPEDSGRDGTCFSLVSPAPPDASDEPCCGPPPSGRSSDYEKPGYTICRFVKGFLETAAGPVPVIATRTGPRDVLGAVRARSGLSRNDYKTAPGLYAVGSPGGDSPVLVTANYKLGFDKLRSCLRNVDAWILVVDTRGINVWCAGGKGLFSAQEIIRQIRLSGIGKVVSHRRLVLPQLAANGVSAREVKKGCGFEVVWGPVRAADIGAFLAGDMKATGQMRRVTFDAAERLVLIPVELYSMWKPALWVVAAAFFLSGIGAEIFSPGEAFRRGGIAFSAFAAGVFTGGALTPVLLPWIPGKMFSLKGMIAGLAGTVPLMIFFRGQISTLEVLALLLVTLAVSSYLAMNFTGSTPYTAPSGVEKEMRISMPFQAGAVAAAAVLWVMAAF